MSEAILRLASSGGQELQRVLGNVRSTYRGVAQAINAEARKAASERENIERAAMRSIDRTTRDQLRSFQAAEREKVRADRERTRQALREAAQRQKAEERAQKQVERAQRDATKVVNAEAKNKVKIAEKEARDIERLTLAQLASREKAEKKATENAARFSRERIRLLETEARTMASAHINAAGRRERTARQDRRETRGQWGQVGRAAWSATSAVVNGANNALGDALSQTHDAEERRAVAGSGLYNAARQTGATAQEQLGYVHQFEQVAAQRGIPLETLVAAAGGAQGTFSTLAGGTAAERAANIQRFLAQAVEAQTIGGTGSIAQHTMLAGLVQQIGGSDAQQRATRLGLAHLTELGAIEETTFATQGMPALMAQVGAAQGALGPNATAEERIQAGHRALVYGAAEMEVMRGQSGYTAGRSGNMFTAMGSSLQSDVTQQRILNNINNAHGMTTAQRNTIREGLFQTDSHGHSTLRAGLTDPVQFAAESARLMRENPVAFQNLFAGGGTGNAQSLQANWRRLSAGMFGRDGNGEAGYERIKRFAQASGEGISDADMARREQLTNADPMTRFVQQEEQRLNALTSNTNSLLTLSHSLDQFRAEHPILASTANQMGGTMGEVAAMTKVNTIDPGGYTASTQRGALWNAFKRGGIGALYDDHATQTEAERITSGGVHSTSNADKYAAKGTVSSSMKMTDGQVHQIADAVRRGMSEAQISAIVSPVDAAHAASTAAAQPRPPAR